MLSFGFIVGLCFCNQYPFPDKDLSMLLNIQNPLFGGFLKWPKKNVPFFTVLGSFEIKCHEYLDDDVKGVIFVEVMEV